MRLRTRHRSSRLIDKFAANIAQGDMAIVADDLYVNYYLGREKLR